MKNLSSLARRAAVASLCVVSFCIQSTCEAGEPPSACKSAIAAAKRALDEHDEKRAIQLLESQIRSSACGSWTDSVQAWSLLKIGYDHIRDFAGAVRAEEALVALFNAANDPRVLVFQQELAEAYRHAGRLEDARAAWRRYFELIERPHGTSIGAPRGHIGLARTYADEGNNETAIEEYELALGFEPLDCQSHRLAAKELADLLSRLGDEERATQVRQENDSACSLPEEDPVTP